MLVDTHAHLDFEDDPVGWIERAKDAGIGKIICVGTSVEASKKCVEIAEKYSKPSKRHSRESGNLKTGFSIKSRMTDYSDIQIYATAGIHAQDGKDDIEKYGSLERCIEELKRIANGSRNKFGMTKSVQNDSGRVVAVGETGFDVHVTGNTGQVTSKKELQFQKELFEVQIELAVELGLPLVVHCRNAWEETFEVLTRFRDMIPDSRKNPELAQQGSTSNPVGVFHSWTGDWEAAKKALGLGFYISFSGIVTFKNATNVQEAAKKIPLERMLLETDSPFLAPEPLRGSKNEPKNVRIVAEFVARLRNLPKDLICDITSENAGRLFGIEN